MASGIAGVVSKIPCFHGGHTPINLTNSFPLHPLTFMTTSRLSQKFPLRVNFFSRVNESVRIFQGKLKTFQLLGFRKLHARAKASQQFLSPCPAHLALTTHSALKKPEEIGILFPKLGNGNTELPKRALKLGTVTLISHPHLSLAELATKKLRPSFQASPSPNPQT